MTGGQAVYTFEEAVGLPAALLGGKGAGLAAMIAQGLPVPPGFTLTTETGLAYLAVGELSEPLKAEVLARLGMLEARLGRRFGGALGPLLVSVRSGAAQSMPGMMDTILNVGLTGPAAGALAARTGDPAYVERSREALAASFRACGAEAPDDPYDQLFTAITTVFDSWRSDRVIAYRKLHGINDHGSSAVTVQAMVHGDLPGSGALSGTGVLFTRDPASGVPGLVGEFIVGGRGSDLVDGTRTPDPLAVLSDLAPALYDELAGYATRLEHWLADMADIEFTIESGKLWLLQVRSGKRTAEAAARIAVDLADEGLITRAEAVRRAAGRAVQGQTLLTEGAGTDVLCTGLAASPGVRSGHAVFDAETAQDYAELGKPVVLVRDFTEASDIHGMAVAEAILTRTGGRMSHAAVVARELGVACVCGAEKLRIEPGGAWADDRWIAEGDLIAVDGANGLVLAGTAETVQADVTPFQRTLSEWRAAL